MRWTTKSAILALAFVALAATAAAEPSSECPECDADGEPGTNSSYSSLDAGATMEGTGEALADTDASLSDENSHTFFGWISICLGALVEAFADVVPVETGANAQADAYASEEGADVDATIGHDGTTMFDFDESPVGEADDVTWQAMGEARSRTGASLGGGVGGHVPPGLDEDACLHDADLHEGC